MNHVQLSFIRLRGTHWLNHFVDYSRESTPTMVAQFFITERATGLVLMNRYSSMKRLIGLPSMMIQILASTTRRHQTTCSCWPSTQCASENGKNSSEKEQKPAME